MSFTSIKYLYNNAISQTMSGGRDLRFTVEQIWLLQRLRGSGLSRDQIVAGLEDLDRLELTANTAHSALGIGGKPYGN